MIDQYSHTGKATSEGQPIRKSSAIKCIIITFILTLPLVNPWVRGDGVGYYAYARALVIDRNLDFEYDWLHANPTFRSDRIENGKLRADNYTSTHHIDNHFSIGPAILWAPLLFVVHETILVLNHFGEHIQADGYSRPYILAMALGTASYALIGLCLAFSLACRYAGETWALISTLAIWFGSSLPVYMYLNPSWSHALSAFVVALFLWYWHRTGEQRALLQWIILGAISGLMIDTYYPNVLLLIVLGTELFLCRVRQPYAQSTNSVKCLLYLAAVLITVSPTLLAHRIIYGSAFSSGYGEKWFWLKPKLFQVLLSSNHGLFSWTPLLIFAVLGLFLLWKQSPAIAFSFVSVFLAFYYLIASYENWHGISSFGNRFFVSLTPLFIIGLAVTLRFVATHFVSRRNALVFVSALVVLLVAWNVGLMLQWGAHMIPVRGPISWKVVAKNQFSAVPASILRIGENYLFRRRSLMQRIEERDMEQLRPNALP